MTAVLSGCGPSEAERAAAELVADPGSARFQNVREEGGLVCGEINARDPAGSYGGYRRFVYDAEAAVARIEPAPAPAAPAAPEGACAKGEAYRSVDERLACATLPQAASGLAEQRLFERMWSRCG